MRIIQLGRDWWIEGASGRYGPFATNAEAWRALDRMDGEPVGKAEAVTDWRLSREMHSE